MTKTPEIPAAIMQEAEELLRQIDKRTRLPTSFALDFKGRATYLAEALLARDTAARKECAEIARVTRVLLNLAPLPAIGATNAIVEAIEATIGGGDDQ